MTTKYYGLFISGKLMNVQQCQNKVPAILCNKKRAEENAKHFRHSYKKSVTVREVKIK